MGRLHAIDKDVSPEYSTVYYGWKDGSGSSGEGLSSMFSIHEKTGVIKLTRGLDYEEQTSYALTAIAFNKMSSDGGNRVMVSEVQVGRCFVASLSKS